MEDLTPGDPITLLLLAPDPITVVTAEITYRGGAGTIAPWYEWQEVGLLTDGRKGFIHDRNESIDWVRGHGDDARATLLLVHSAG